MGLEIVYINGSNGSVYGRTDLSGVGTLAAGAYLVVGPASVPLPEGTARVDGLAATNAIQNGAPDAIVLLDGTGELVDALSYEGGLTDVTIDTMSYNLVFGTAASARDSNDDEGSLQRIPNGVRSGDDDADWRFSATLTPGAANVLD